LILLHISKIFCIGLILVVTIIETSIALPTLTDEENGADELSAERWTKKKL